MIQATVNIRQETAHQELNPLDSAVSPGGRKYRSNQKSEADPREMTVGELYGCLCHQRTSDFPTLRFPLAGSR
ncbi:MAG: hypothetical protein ACREQV_13025 [Candidatus Binatia bacterium]